MVIHQLSDISEFEFILFRVLFVAELQVPHRLQTLAETLMTRFPVLLGLKEGL